jgi:hypothetical protein
MKIIILIFLLVFYSCGSVKDKNTKKVQNVIELNQAKIIEKEKLYIYDSRNFSLELPYSWRSYQEPQAKEQIRHSPFNKEESKVETETYFLLSVVHTKKNVKKAIVKQMRKMEYYAKNDGYYKSVSKIEEDEGTDALGSFIKHSFFFSQKKKRYKKNIYYYMLEGKYLFCSIVYPASLSESKQNEISEILKTIKVKD